jgi:hypothetical protein
MKNHRAEIVDAIQSSIIDLGQQYELIRMVDVYASELRNQSWLGEWTTRQLLDELRNRLEAAGLMNYKTVIADRQKE